MIPFFRRIRKKMADDNKPLKYARYAIGEIVLVVIGILIALYINNWNEDRIQANELEGLKKGIANAIRSDIKYLNLIKSGRKDIGEKADSIFNNYISSQNSALTFGDYAYISNGFTEIKNTIYYQPNTSSFEALKNSILLSKLQGTDLELLLSSYYDAGKRLQKKEEDYNNSLNADYENWSNKFRNKNGDFLLRPWIYLESHQFQEKFLETLNDTYSKNVLENGFKEQDMIELYDLQIMLGEKFVEMVDKGEINFDLQTQIDFSGTFYSYSEVDVLNLLVDGKIPSDFGTIYAQSGKEYYDGINFENDAMILTYPDNKLAWGSPYFTIDALNNRVNEMEFTKYTNIILEMKGANGGEEFAIMMKDKYDLPDGKESRVDITVSKSWETYIVPIEKFETADKEIIQTPLGFVFLGDQGRTIYVRSVQFK